MAEAKLTSFGNVRLEKPVPGYQMELISKINMIQLHIYSNAVMKWSTNEQKKLIIMEQISYSGHWKIIVSEMLSVAISDITAPTDIIISNDLVA